MKMNPTGRRDFLKKAGSITTGLGLAGFLPHLAACQSSQKTLGIALVGLGYYSTDLLAPALQETQFVKLTGIVTGSPEKAKTWQDKYNIKPANVYNYQNFDQMASNPDIDIVYIVLPNSLHAEFTIRAAKAGKHVICEKPMALNVAECEAMIKACKENNRMLSIGYRMHFEPTTQEIMRLGQQKVYGPVKMVSAGAGYNHTSEGHWKIKKETGGGAMMDMGVYSLQAARYATGEEPIRVTAQAHIHRPEMFTEVEETMTFQLTFPSGAIANLHTSFGMNMNYLHVTAEKGWFKLDPFSSYRGIKGESKDGPFNFPVINQQAAQMDDVARCIMEGKPMRVPGEEGLKDMKVVEAIYEAARTGKAVEIPA